MAHIRLLGDTILKRYREMQASFSPALKCQLLQARHTLRTTEFLLFHLHQLASVFVVKPIAVRLISPKHRSTIETIF